MTRDDTPRWRRQFRPGPGALATLQQACAEFLDAQGIDGRTRYGVELVVEEWLTNVVRHGHADAAAASIDIELQAAPDHVTLRFSDSGRAFDPTQAAAPAAPKSLAEAQPGGLGLAMMRNAARRMAYQRQDGMNHLVVEIARPAAEVTSTP